MRNHLPFLFVHCSVFTKIILVKMTWQVSFSAFSAGKREGRK